MDAINKYLSPLTDIGADIWNAEETPDFPLPLKKKEEVVPEKDNAADDVLVKDDNNSEATHKESLSEQSVAEKESDNTAVEGAGDTKQSVSEDGPQPVTSSADDKEDKTSETSEGVEAKAETEAVLPETKVQGIPDSTALNQTVDIAIEKIVEQPKETDDDTVSLSSQEPEAESIQSQSTSFISTLRIVSRNDDAGMPMDVEANESSTLQGEKAGNMDLSETVESKEDPLFVAHVVAPLAKTIGSLAYRYHLTLSLETEEKELRALLGRVRSMADSIGNIFKQSGVTAIGLNPRFMYVSRPIVQQAYELYHAPLSDTYFIRLQHIVENLAHFSLRLFPQNWHVGELDAHDRLDVFEALSPVVVALGQSEDDKTETLVKDVCQTLLNKVQEWCAQGENGVYSDNARMLSRFSSIFADIYLTEVERFSNLEPQEKHIYLNTYNQAPSLPIIWDLFDKKVEMLRKISDSVDNSSVSLG